MTAPPSLLSARGDPGTTPYGDRVLAPGARRKDVGVEDRCAGKYHAPESLGGTQATVVLALQELRLHWQAERQGVRRATLG